MEPRRLLSAATGPTALLTAGPTVTTAGTASIDISVTYADAADVALSSIDAADLTVTGPTGTTLTISAATTDATANAPSITATYTVDAPSGTFTAADDGTYDVALAPGQVTDVVGDAAAVVTVGGFTVAVGDPSASLSAVASVTAAGTGPVSLVVTYAGASAPINPATIDAGNLAIVGPTGTTVAIATAVSGTADGDALPVTYTASAPAGGWSAADDGTYAVQLLPGQVTDTADNAVPAATLGSFTVAVAAPVVIAPASSAVSITTPAATVKSGNVAEFIATVTGTLAIFSGVNDGVVPLPTGTVTFFDGATALATEPLGSAASATFSTAALAAGGHEITADYSGDASYPASASTGGALVDVTGPATTAPALAPTLGTARLPASVVAGAHRPLSLPVRVTNTGAAAEHGTVTLTVYASTDDLLDLGDTVVATQPHAVTLKPGKTLHLTVGVPSLPQTLTAGSYRLLVQVTDSAGFAQTTSTAATIAVAAPVLTPAVAFGRVTVPTSLTADARTHGGVLLDLTNDGNVAVAGLLTVTITLVGSDGTPAETLATVSRREPVPVGRSKAIAVLIPTVPTVAAGTYTLAAQVLVPATAGASAASASAVDSVQVTVVAPT
jgi:hypothetical protein